MGNGFDLFYLPYQIQSIISELVTLTSCRLYTSWMVCRWDWIYPTRRTLGRLSGVSNRIFRYSLCLGQVELDGQLLVRVVRLFLTTWKSRLVCFLGPISWRQAFFERSPKSWSTWPSNFWLIYFSQDSLCVLGSYLFIYFLQSLRSNTQYKASSSYRLDRLLCVTARPVSFFRCVVFHYSSGFQRFFWGRKWWKQLTDQSGVV